MSYLKGQLYPWIQGLLVAFFSGALKALTLTGAAIGINDQQTFNLSSSWNAKITGQFFLVVFGVNILTDLFLYMQKSPPPLPADDKP